MTDAINFLDSEKLGVLVEVRGNLIGGKYIAVKDMQEMLRIYNGGWKGKGKRKKSIVTEPCVRGG